MTLPWYPSKVANHVWNLWSKLHRYSNQLGRWCASQVVVESHDGHGHPPILAVFMFFHQTAAYAQVQLPAICRKDLNLYPTFLVGLHPSLMVGYLYTNWSFDLFLWTVHKVDLLSLRRALPLRDADRNLRSWSHWRLPTRMEDEPVRFKRMISIRCYSGWSWLGRNPENTPNIGYNTPQGKLLNDVN